MDSRHYGGGVTVPALGVLTTEQRRRAEAVTLARALLPSTSAVGEWLRLADYITTGNR